MPVYLLHGFRWPRAGNSGIRVHCILHNLEDCSVEYIQNANSTADLLKSFRMLFPDIMKELEGPGRGLTFLEQYDPDDESSDSAVSQPYAFIGDKVVTIVGGPRAMAAAGLKRPDSSSGRSTTGNGKALKAVAAANGSALSVNVEEVVAEGPGITPAAWEALAELRDKLAEKEKIGWWIVYNGDPERTFDEDTLDEGDADGMDGEEEEEEVVTPVAVTNKELPKVPSRAEELSRQQRSGISSAPTRSTASVLALPIRDATGKRAPETPGRIEKSPISPPSSDPTRPKTSSKSEGFKKFFGKRT